MNKKRNAAKLYLNNVPEQYHFVPFFGIGNIITEQSNLKDIKRVFGKPDKDYTDERRNRILDYQGLGFSFKFLEIFNASKKNPVVSFIKIREPFVDEGIGNIYPGLDRTSVNFRMRNFHPTEVKENEEIWKNKVGRKMKFVYGDTDILEMIIII